MHAFCIVLQLPFFYTTSSKADGPYGKGFGKLYFTITPLTPLQKHVAHTFPLACRFHVQLRLCRSQDNLTTAQLLTAG